jgi:hypothetical protein
MKSKMGGSFFDKPGSYAHALCPGSQWLFNFENKEKRGFFETLVRPMKKSNNRGLRGPDARCQPAEVQRRLDISHARAERLWKQDW